MLRSPTIWLAALWIGVMIHLDWHLGRSGHDHRSFDLTYHWLLALPTFVPVACLIVRTWPTSPATPAVLITLLGVVVGQGLEPLGEVIYFNAGVIPFTSTERWRIFAQFTAAGLTTLFATLLVIRRELPGINQFSEGE
jgi:hypothetical protein